MFFVGNMLGGSDRFASLNGGTSLGAIGKIGFSFGSLRGRVFVMG
jgi:hypothetical protein